MFGGEIILTHRSVSQFFQEWIKVLVNCLFLSHKVAGLCQWRSQAEFFIVRSHSLEWGFAYIYYYPLPPYHPVSVLNTTSSVVFWHAPSEFFNFNFRPHNDSLGLFLNFLLYKLCKTKTPLLIMSISILGVLITSLI